MGNESAIEANRNPGSPTRIVLHIGQQKTGSSAIQDAFFLSQDYLKNSGVAYPLVNSGDVQVRTQFILGALLESSKFARKFQTETDTRRKEATSDEALASFFASLKNLVIKDQPKVIILSSEVLFRPVTANAAQRLKSALAEISPDIEVVAYVRAPAQRYLAGLQQKLRSSGRVIPPRESLYRAVLAGYLAAFGDRLKVIEYDRSKLKGGDIVEDFVHRFVPELVREELTRSSDDVNPGYSAEVMSVLQDYSSGTADSSSDSWRTHRIIIEEILYRDAGASPSKARLKPDIARSINEASVDLLWLREQFGIQFAGIDYEQIGSSKLRSSTEDWIISDICAVDPAELRRLRSKSMSVLLEIASRSVPREGKKRRTMLDEVAR